MQFNHVLSVHVLQVLTGGKIQNFALAELIVQLRVEYSCVLCVRAQIPQRVPGEPAWDPLFDGTGALEAQVETVASDNSTGSLPSDQCTIRANVSKTYISGGVGFWRRQKI